MSTIDGFPEHDQDTASTGSGSRAAASLWQTIELTPGERLIEASAGTGKTFTLAHLWVRYVILKQPPLREVAAVTFTKAAAKELKIRFQELLMAVDAAIEQTRHTSNASPEEHALLQHFRASGLSDLVISTRIQDVLSRFDEVQISTIHSFADRLVRRIGGAFDHRYHKQEKPTLEIPELITHLVQSYSAQLDDALERLLAEAPEHQRWIHQSLIRLWLSPMQLEKIARTYLEQQDLKSPRRMMTQQEAVQAAIEALEDLMSQLTVILQHKSEILKSFESLQQHKMIDLRTFHKKTYVRLQESLEAVEDFVARTSTDSDDLLSLQNLLQPLQAYDLISRTDKVKDDARPEWLDAFRPLHMVQHGIELMIATLDDVSLSFRLDFLAFIDAECRRLSDDFSLSFFSQSMIAAQDIVQHISQELPGAPSKDLSRQAFHALSRAPYCLLLVDEFQDCDAIQADIFERLSRFPGVSTYYVGDPKQAIYAFRNANLETYLHVKSRVGEHYFLDTNWRSTPELIASLNRLYADDPEIFGRSDLTAYSVKAGLGDTSVINAPFISYAIQSETSLNQNDALELKVDACLQWLQELNIDITQQSVAFLLHDNKQIHHVMRRLGEYGYPTYAPIARKVQDDIQSIRTLLHFFLSSDINAGQMTAWILGHWKWFQHHNAQNHIETETRLFRLWQYYRDIYNLDSGLGVMIRMLCQAFTDSELSLGEHDQAMWEQALSLASRIDNILEHESLSLDRLYHELQDDVRAEVRLSHVAESTALSHHPGKITCMTIHRSKGLEFDIVILPSLLDASVRTPDASPSLKQRTSPDYIRSYPQTGETRRTLLLSHRQYPEAQKAIASELHEEDARKKYVALTRAKSQIIMPYIDDPKSNVPTSGVFNNKACTITKHLERSADSVSVVTYIPSESTTEASTQRSVKTLIQPISYPAVTYSTTSFSGVKAGSKTSMTERFAHMTSTSSSSGAETHHPRGPQFGSFVHAFLEELPAFDMNVASLEQHFVAMPQPAFSVDPRWFAEYIWRILNAELHVADMTFRLSDVPIDHMWREWSFDFELTAEMIQNLPLHLAEQLNESLWKGSTSYMTGEIDLIVQHAGRYIIVDYKTNDLGGIEGYRGAQLESAVQSQKYDLQAHLYGLALAQHLQTLDPSIILQQKLPAALFYFTRGQLFPEDSLHPKTGIHEISFDWSRTP